MTVTLSWTPNTESDFLEYRLYLGRASGVYDETFNVLGDEVEYLRIEPPAAQVTLSAPDGVTMHFALSAVDQTGNESAKSSSVTKINKYTRFATA